MLIALGRLGSERLVFNSGETTTGGITEMKIHIEGDVSFEGASVTYEQKQRYRYWIRA